MNEEQDKLFALLQEAKISKGTLERNIEKAIEQKASMKALIELPAFGTYLKELSSQIDRRLQELCTTRPGLDGAVQNTHSIGEIAGLKIAQNLASTMIETADEAMKLNRHALEQGLYFEESEEENNG